MNGIIIGKHTLESLTSGMYSDSYVVYREYIQNSVDSIDEAIQSGILKSGDDRITVQLIPSENQIIITDNGLGIQTAEAEKTLISIGNSKKTSESSRGFRGIGRLAALSYCHRLTFLTSFKGESVATRIEIDASKLSEVLADNSQSDLTVIDVLKSVYTLSTSAEKESAHYFTVKMDGIDVNSRLLSFSDVEDYLSQNAPVPYRPDFVWGKEIVKRLRREGLEIDVYNICLEYGTKTTTLYKPYRDEFIVDKGKNISDTVQDITVLRIPSDGNNLSAVGWLAKTNYMGSIYEKSIKGLRLRKGNILIGDHQTLNVVFKDARFNGWAIGEIFAIDKLLVPNARRDNFEKNPAYFALFEQLTTLAAGITKDIRAASLKRNNELSNAIEKLNASAQKAAEAIDEGVSGTQKGLITKELNEAKNAVSNSNIKGASEQYCQDIAFAELDMLIGKLKGITKYKALNTIDGLTNTEKKILERVIQVVDSLNLECSDQVIEAILNDFSS
jgi:hypothetical protein